MEQKEKQYHSGFVTIVGRPNVGKSSLRNRMIGEKIAIVSSRPQTTRSRIMGVLTQPGYQIVFLDTPGIHDPRTKLGEYMMRSVRDAMDGMDGLLVMVDATSVGAQDRQLVSDMESARDLDARKKTACLTEAEKEQFVSLCNKLSGHIERLALDLPEDRLPPPGSPRGPRAPTGTASRRCWT